MNGGGESHLLDFKRPTFHMAECCDEVMVADDSKCR